MEVSSKHQMYVFVLCILAGIGCGLFFDVQRSLRKVINAGNMRTAAEDTLFVMVCSGVAIAVGFIFNRGQIRYYQIMGLLSGALFYAACLSCTAMKLIEFLYRFFVRIIIIPVVKIINIVIWPFVTFYTLIRRKTAVLKRFAMKKKRRFSVKFKKVKKRMKML